MSDDVADLPLNCPRCDRRSARSAYSYVPFHPAASSLSRHSLDRNATDGRSRRSSVRRMSPSSSSLRSMPIGMYTATQTSSREPFRTRHNSSLGSRGRCASIIARWPSSATCAAGEDCSSNAAPDSDTAAADSIRRVYWTTRASSQRRIQRELAVDWPQPGVRV